MPKPIPTGNQGEKRHYSQSDKLAIALAFLGTAIATVVTLVVILLNKTPLVIFLLLLMASCLIYPVIHFMTTPTGRTTSFAVLAIGTIGCGLLILRFENQKFVPLPVVATPKPPELVKTPVQSEPCTPMAIFNGGSFSGRGVGVWNDGACSEFNGTKFDARLGVLNTPPIDPEKVLQEIAKQQKNKPKPRPAP